MDQLSRDLNACAETLERHAERCGSPEFKDPLEHLAKEADKVGKAWCGSWLGYHANVYYKDLQPPRPGAHFSVEWGLKELYSGGGTTGDWEEHDPEAITDTILRRAGNPDLDSIEKSAAPAAEAFSEQQQEMGSILAAALANIEDPFLIKHQKEIDEQRILNASDVINSLRPKSSVLTRDSVALGQGQRIPPHFRILADAVALQQPATGCAKMASIARQAAKHLDRLKQQGESTAIITGHKIFIGHGRSPLWRELKDFLEDRLGLAWDEFNRVPVAGVSNSQRLSEMLKSASFALLIFTGEDESADGDLLPRMNVVHEAGLFQGRLGFNRAIVLLENECSDFSNIHGLGQIRFPKGNIAAKFEEIRKVLKREGLVTG